MFIILNMLKVFSFEVKIIEDFEIYSMATFFGDVSRFSGLLVFLLLEIICFILIVQFNQKQRDILFHSGSLASGKMLETTNQFANYFQLSEVADSIANENARLMQRISNEKSQPVIIFSDTLEVKIDTSVSEKYELIPARVINNSVNKNHNYFTLNKGARNGLESNMGLVTAAGLVGVVRKVSDNYALAMSVLNRQSRISVAVRRNKFFGTLLWKGNDPQIMDLEDIPKHADLIVGDTIVTSGYSTMFPSGLTVGYITEFEVEQGNNFYTAKVRLSENPGSLEYVFAVKHLQKDEIKELEATIENE